VSYCSLHPQTQLVCPRCIGKKGGKVTTRKPPQSALSMGQEGWTAVQGLDLCSDVPSWRALNFTVLPTKLGLHYPHPGGFTDSERLNQAVPSPNSGKRLQNPRHPRAKRRGTCAQRKHKQTAAHHVIILRTRLNFVGSHFRTDISATKGTS